MNHDYTWNQPNMFIQNKKEKATQIQLKLYIYMIHLKMV